MEKDQIHAGCQKNTPTWRSVNSYQGTAQQRPSKAHGMASGQIHARPNMLPQSFTPSDQVQRSIAKNSPASYNLGDRLDAATNTTLQQTLKAFPQIQQSPNASKTKLSNIPTLRSWPNNDLLNLCDPLGFIKGPISIPTRQHLAQAINSCLETHGGRLNEIGCPISSETLAWRFLTNYGADFWGEIIEREHLKERDISKGLLYPRDAERLSNALAMIFRDRLRFKERGDYGESSRTISAVANPPEINTTPKPDKAYKLYRTTESLHNGKEDASSPLISRSSKPPTSNRKTAEEDNDDDDDDDIILSWNHLLPEVLEEKLRPLERKSMQVRRYTNAEIGGIQPDGENVHDKKRQPSQSPAEKPPAKRLKRVYRRMSTPPPMQGSPTTKSAKKGRSKGQDAKRSKNAEESPETDSDAPLRSTRRPTLKKALLTPALTEEKVVFTEEKVVPSKEKVVPSKEKVVPTKEKVVPTKGKVVPSSKNVIALDSSSEDERPSQKSQKSGTAGVMEAGHSTSRIKVEGGLPTVHDILSQEICQKTTLLVMADHEKDKAPITIALPQCSSSDDLFDRLILESELPNDLSRKVKSVSATFKWNGRRLRLRKHHAEDWQRFQKEVSQGWASGELGEEGEVEMMMHIGG